MPDSRDLCAAVARREGWAQLEFDWSIKMAVLPSRSLVRPVSTSKLQSSFHPIHPPHFPPFVESREDMRPKAKGSNLCLYIVPYSILTFRPVPLIQASPAILNKFAPKIPWKHQLSSYRATYRLHGPQMSFKQHRCSKLLTFCCQKINFRDRRLISSDIQRTRPNGAFIKTLQEILSSCLKSFVPYV